ncbi:MAG: 4-carboxymuconolactone decarboxylase [Betaproteobacteria bacterium RIFCSPLOWO2_12_FULL_65_14]|nr:MAG: 4-carboxymuconolactone decarboxylase [Betaproteobacteria bacterium RIFCSPLOWO2_12_FULL_65_14]
MDKRDHKQRYDAGLKTRREVLGAGYVDKAMAGTEPFSQEFVELLNTYCWNDIWNRPGLSRKMRSVLNLGMLCALNNGLTKDEIKEVFLQVAIYCGVPAAVVAFRAAKEVFQSDK